MGKERGSKPLRNITNISRAKRRAVSELVLTETEKIARDAHAATERNEVCSMHKYGNVIAEYYEELDRVFSFLETGITYEMRSLVIDWIISCHEQLGLSDDTLFLAIFIVDRFLSGRNISSQKLQLVGIAALMIASKYEEVVCPDLKGFVLLGGRNSTESELRKAEKYILYALNYTIEYVNPLYFLRRASKANHYEAKSRKMAKYFLELMMLHKEFCIFTKAVLGSTAMYLARKICQTDYNRNLFIYYTRVDKNEMRRCFEELVRVIYQPPKYENVEAKYAKPAFLKVSVEPRQYAQLHFK